MPEVKNMVLHRLLEGHRPTLFDVGARWSVHQRWRRFSGDIRVVGFEPDREECERLNALATEYSARYYPVALGERVGTATLYKTVDPGSSSFLEPNTALASNFEYGQYLKLTGTVEVQLTTLDTFCEERNVYPDALKIDTQGTELAILSGGPQALGRTSIVELEVEFAPLYRDQPLFADVDVFLRSRGFVLLGIRRTYWRRLGGANSPSPLGGQLVHGDALYYHEATIRAADLSRPRFLSILLLLSAYNQFDLVYDMLQTHPAALSLPHAEIDGVRRELILKPSGLGRVAAWLSRRLKYSKVREVATAFRTTPAYDWHDPDYF
jgi:FkbM family methyltransferase